VLAEQPDGDEDVLEQIGTLEKRVERLDREFYADETPLTKDRYLAIRVELVERIADLGNQVGPRRRPKQLPPNLREWWPTAPIGERKEIIASVVERVIIHPVGRGDRRFNPDAVEIIWRA